MRVVIRVDASIESGVGHVMRCLTLARELARHGATVSFISREHPGNLCDFIEEMGFLVSRLPEPLADVVYDNSLNHAPWLGASWVEDALQTLTVIDTNSEKPDWLVVDHYAIEERWEIAVAPSVTRIMVIDDLADRNHACSVLLDQNLVANLETRYLDKVPTTCKLLAGPKFAMLQPEYAHLHEVGVPSFDSIRRIFVFFGGSDEHNLTGRCLSALLSLGKLEIEVDVVTSANSPHANSIRRQIKGHANIHLHSNLHTLAPLMHQADLAIGAAGTTSWERLCLGLPALVVTLADNQRPIAAELNRRGLIRWLGDQDRVEEANFSQALIELFAKPSLSEEFSSGRDLVDGKGVHRVWASMVVVPKPILRARKATLADESLLLEWANDPTTRANAFCSSKITEKQHSQWFRHRVHNDDFHLYIIETLEAVQLGQVRFERVQTSWIVDYSLSYVFREFGLGKGLLETALLRLRTEEPEPLVLGEVKADNIPSRKVFESIGFSVLYVGQKTLKYVCKINK